MCDSKNNNLTSFRRCNECGRCFRFRKKRKRLNGYCSWDCKDKAFFRYQNDCERLKKEVCTLTDTVSKLNEELFQTATRLLDKENQIWAKDREADHRSDACVWSYPSFLSSLKQQMWFFCWKGNCNENKHLEDCEWQLCSHEATRKLTELCEKKKTDSEHLDCTLVFHLTPYRITGCISSLQQTRIDTGMVRNLRRVTELSYVSPSQSLERLSRLPRVPLLHYWTICASALVPFSQMDHDMGDIIFQFLRETKVSTKILQVESICNAKSYLNFNLEHHIRFLRSKKQSTPPPKLVFAFHGFGESKVESILEDGLHLYFSKAGVFSRGIYVSTSADVCDSYYTTKQRAFRQLLFCLVNVGNHYQSTTDETWNSDNPCQKDGILLDSVGFQHGGAQAYVVPSPSQIYPLAVITY